MKCEIARDLLPLYIDGCCSEESRAAVEEHLRSCAACREILDAMRQTPGAEPIGPAPVARDVLGKIRGFQASILQSVLLFAAFTMVTVGVALEAATPEGIANGRWAFRLVIPSTGFLLSLANWYFVRQYPSRHRFAACSMWITLGLTLCAVLWGLVHYGVLAGRVPAQAFLTTGLWGLLLTAVFCAISRLLADRYATMIGKE